MNKGRSRGVPRDTVTILRNKIRRFSEERDWDQFHSPKNLSMALAVEASELMEHFQWLTEQKSKRLDGKKKDSIEDEIGDVLIYLLRLSDKLGIDLLAAGDKKLTKNAAKYPVHKARGNAKKYTEL